MAPLGFVTTVLALRYLPFYSCHVTYGGTDRHVTSDINNCTTCDRRPTSLSVYKIYILNAILHLIIS